MKNRPDILEPHTIFVRRREVTSDNMGGQKVDWVDVAETKGRVSLPAGATAQAILQAQQSQERITYYVYLRPEDDIRRGDQIIHDTRVMWVEAITAPSVELYRRAECRQGQREGEPPL